MNQFARPGLAVTELPSFNENDKGKVLKIDSESGVLGWGESGGSGLPSTDAASAGDVLSLDNSKDPVWSAPSGGGVLVVHDVNGTLDKTWQEISDAGFAILRIENDIGITCYINHSDGYYVKFAMLLPNGSGFDDPIGYTTSTASGYPVMQE